MVGPFLAVYSKMWEERDRLLEELSSKGEQILVVWGYSTYRSQDKRLWFEVFPQSSCAERHFTGDFEMWDLVGGLVTGDGPLK